MNEPLLQVEKWECRACGIDAPCSVEITFSDAKLPEHLKGNQRFRTVCLCAENQPDWKRIHDGQNAESEVSGVAIGYRAQYNDVRQGQAYRGRD